MRTLIRLRPINSPPTELVVDGAYFVDPDSGEIDQEIDTHGWTAVAGLVDAHAHLGASNVEEQRRANEAESLIAASTNMWAQLRSGVFLVFEKGGRTDACLRLMAEPPAFRPALSMAGRMIATPGGYFPAFAAETEPADLAKHVAGVTDSGAGWVKLVGDWPRRGLGAVPNFTEEQLADAVTVAHAAGLKVAIHTNAPDTPGMAVRAGVDSIEHGLFLTVEDLDALGRRRGVWVPTIRAMESVGDSLGRDSSGGRLFEAGLNNVRELLASATAKGVVTMCGTDLVLGHGDVAHEAIRMVDYGMSTIDAVDAVTINGLHYVGLPSTFRPGLPASVVFFDGDPRDDISVLAHPQMVIHHGRTLNG